jgi:hypothetical protein
VTDLLRVEGLTRHFGGLAAVVHLHFRVKEGEIFGIIVLPGMFARVEVLLPEESRVLVIPATSVLSAPYGDSVYVIESKPGKDGGPPALTSCRGLQTISGGTILRTGSPTCPLQHGEVRRHTRRDQSVSVRQRGGTEVRVSTETGAQASWIQVRYEGIEGLTLDESGALHVRTALGELVRLGLLLRRRDLGISGTPC